MSESTNTVTSAGRGGAKTRPSLHRLTWVYCENWTLEDFRKAHFWTLGLADFIVGRDASADITLQDDQASREHFRLIALPPYDTFFLEDLGSKNGTYVNGQAVPKVELKSGDVVEIGQSLLVYSKVQPPPGETGLEKSPIALARASALFHAARIAKTEMPVLITGPTGAGKERIAEYIHEESGRDGPLVSANCAAFNAELLGSELFGHEKGAFSGAVERRQGLIQRADGGTLFMDEVADLPRAQQAVLLRALQNKRVQPVGADHEVSIDFRVVAATNTDLEAQVERGEFRSDLYARIAGGCVELPGLVDRKEELLSLFFDFLEAPVPLDIARASSISLAS